MNGREEGGQCYSLQTCDQERFEARKVVFPWECLIIFATGCSKLPSLRRPVFIPDDLTSETLKSSVKCVVRTHLTEDVKVVRR